MKLNQVMFEIEDQMRAMLDRSKSMQSYLNRVVYRQYQNAQRRRWMTENSSEGNKWPVLNKKYADTKKIKFANFPGKGQKMLIATGELMDSVIGPKGTHKKIVTNKRIEVAWGTPYAVYVQETRDFVEFGEKTMNDIYEGLGKFIMEGIMMDVGR